MKTILTRSSLSLLTLTLLCGAAGDCGGTRPPHDACSGLPRDRCASNPTCEPAPAPIGVARQEPGCQCVTAPCDCPSPVPPPDSFQCQPRRACDELDALACDSRSDCRALFSRAYGVIKPLPEGPRPLPAGGSAPSEGGAPDSPTLAPDPGPAPVPSPPQQCEPMQFVRCENGPSCPALRCAVACERYAVDANGCQTCGCELEPLPPPGPVCPAVRGLALCAEGFTPELDENGCETCGCEPVK